MIVRTKSVLALVKGSWGYSKIEDFVCVFFFLLENICGATDCRVNFCWIVIVNVVSDSKFERKSRKYFDESDRRYRCWWNSLAAGFLSSVLFIMLYCSQAAEHHSTPAMTCSALFYQFDRNSSLILLPLCKSTTPFQERTLRRLRKIGIDYSGVVSDAYLSGLSSFFIVRFCVYCFGERNFGLKLFKIFSAVM